MLQGTFNREFMFFMAAEHLPNRWGRRLKAKERMQQGLVDWQAIGWERAGPALKEGGPRGAAAHPGPDLWSLYLRFKDEDPKFPQSLHHPAPFSYSRRPQKTLAGTWAGGTLAAPPTLDRAAGLETAVLIFWARPGPGTLNSPAVQPTLEHPPTRRVTNRKNNG